MYAFVKGWQSLLAVLLSFLLSLAYESTVMDGLISFISRYPLSCITGALTLFLFAWAARDALAHRLEGYVEGRIRQARLQNAANRRLQEKHLLDAINEMRDEMDMDPI